jgi:UDP-N-acetylglucosamine--dolichyl-phosphate N-acetylglucosaminephosphotransferase
MPFHLLPNKALAALPLIPPAYLLAAAIPYSVVKKQLLLSVGLSAFGFAATVAIIPKLAKKMPSLLTGKDMCKKGTAMADKDVPESMGIVAGTVCLCCITFTQVFYASSIEKSLDFSSALLSICFMMFLGFADDVLDLPWSARIITPALGSLPLLCAYRGLTSVVLPAIVRPLLSTEGDLTLVGKLLNLVVGVQSDGAILELGHFFSLYMLLIIIFCTQAINILAGINGLEAGQSYIIGCSILVFNLCEIAAARGDETDERHLFSLLLIIPFTTATLGLLYYNWYPSRVFVGDTFCYFAGMTFAVCGVLGHFSKTLMLFFIPQLINFALSLPQLAKIVPCPRHRLPAYNQKTGLLEPSQVIGASKYQGRGPTAAEEAKLKGVPNLTLINMFLVVFGPMNERSLATSLLAFQAFCSAVGFAIRYGLPIYLYPEA